MGVITLIEPVGTDYECHSPEMSYTFNSSIETNRAGQQYPCKNHLDLQTAT